MPYKYEFNKSKYKFKKFFIIKKSTCIALTNVLDIKLTNVLLFIIKNIYTSS